MSFTITCYTLFDITNTGVTNRSKPSEGEDETLWNHKRKTQCNFDTIIQAISLRSQPDVLAVPEKIQIKFDEFKHFGFLFDQLSDEAYNCWTFDFEIQHPSVFDDGISELGALYSDCDGVPMLSCDTNWDKLPKFLDGSDEMRNIYFMVKNND